MDIVYVDATHHDDENSPDQPEIYGLDGSDDYRLFGNFFTRAYGGDGGDDIEYFGGAFAHLYGGEGTDLLTGGKLGDDLYGGDGNDSLRGDTFSETDEGGDDYLDGGRGDDHLTGEAGADELSGGPGADTFHMAEPVKGMPVDTITDFKPGVDLILLASVFFPDISPPPPFDGVATLKAGKFFLGGKAKDGGDRIGYNPKNGDVIYDPNGDHKGGKVVIAELDAGLKVTHNDFLLAG